MLKLLDITKEYMVEKESTLALKGVSIQFRKNEFVSILGPSGCGKTTLLNIIGGLDRYTSGDIQIDGISTKQYDDVDWDTYRNRKIGFVFQSYNLIPHMNVLKNVAMGLTLAGVEREERKERALEALRKVGLESQARKKPNQLSGGQMQRVAIARALVNNPDIILADEPTGALDSESGVQVMDLLKEVAEDRLVIMVTHNPMLAEEYSTRIVYLKDGEVEGDTMPYDEDEDSDKHNDGDGGDGSTMQKLSSAEADAENAADSVAIADTSHSEEGKKPCKLRHELFKKRLWKRRQLDKSAMKLSTAINLSWNNLLSKKGRTLLTSIAGSIGIIGIILVLSLSTGARLYIKNLEQSALSTYPISVKKASMDVTTILNMLMSSSPDKNGDVDDSVITTQEVLGGILKNLDSMTDENDLYSFKKYIDANFDSELASVKYNYGTSFNAYALNPKHNEEYMKINPYAEMMYAVFDDMLEKMPALGEISFEMMGRELTISDMLGMMAESDMIGSPWAELSDNQKLLDSQYELVGDSHWPSAANEVVVVVSENNTIMDYQLFMLGLKSTDDVIEALTSGILGGSFAEATFEVDEIIGREMKILTNADYLDDNGDGTWSMHNRKDLTKNYVDAHAMEFADGSTSVKVVGVVRPKKGVVATSINGVIGYSSRLTEAMFSHAKNHPAVSAMLKLHDDAVADDKDMYKSIINFSYKTDNQEVQVMVGDDIKFTDSEEHTSLMRALGSVDKEYPASISFYCSSFDAKEDIVNFIEKYQKDTGNKIKYTDSLSSMMAFVNTMADTITGVLIAFAAISLVVSTIMIAIIIYTSVLERRKEIGVLRSIGARKKDISRVFLAESAILGGYSGVIGIIISVILSFVGSAILKAVFNIEGLMTIEWWHCLLMLAISVLLSMLAGFIPSRIAAKKDPAIALRSE